MPRRKIEEIDEDDIVYQQELSSSEEFEPADVDDKLMKMIRGFGKSGQAHKSKKPEKQNKKYLLAKNDYMKIAKYMARMQADSDSDSE